MIISCANDINVYKVIIKALSHVLIRHIPVINNLLLKLGREGKRRCDKGEY